MAWLAIFITTIMLVVTSIYMFTDGYNKVLGAVCAALTIPVVIIGLWAAPNYTVWQQQLAGKAELARAEQNRQILINEALAKQQSAKHWANAEVERARGAAEANKIMADSLGSPEQYLKWLWIEKLDEIKNGQIIYLPSDGGMPITEATRINK